MFEQGQLIVLEERFEDHFLYTRRIDNQNMGLVRRQFQLGHQLIGCISVNRCCPNLPKPREKIT